MFKDQEGMFQTLSMLAGTRATIGRAVHFTFMKLKFPTSVPRLRERGSVFLAVQPTLL